MLQIRTGVFETNSSSTHSLTICEANDFEKFKSGEMIMVSGKIMSFKEAIIAGLENRWISDEDKVKLNKLLEDSEADKEQVLGVLSEILDVCKNYSDYEANHSDLEQFERSHTTESGDKIVAFGYYGYDG